MPTRDRRPALAALAVLLILGGGLVSGLIVFRSGERADYLVLRHEVAPGQRITESDLGIARIAGTGAKAIPATQKRTVVGAYATTRLFSGTLITREMVEEARSEPAGSAVVGLALEAAQAPAGGVQVGDIVRVLLVPDRGSDGDPVILVDAARVVGGGLEPESGGGLGGGAPRSGDSIAISLLVPLDVSSSIAAASAQGQAAVVVLPPDTKTEIG